MTIRAVARLSVAILLSSACQVHGQIAAPHEFYAEEARQAVAVDEDAVYVVNNRTIGKYDKRSGERIGAWEGPGDGPIQHLNSGVVIGDKLYAAHSNYPHQPMISSVEIWDSSSLRHIESHSFGIYEGSATWVDFFHGTWWVVFANYATKGGTPGKGPEWTVLVQFDTKWRRMSAWTLPKTMVDALSPYSNSGGSWGPDGSLYLTGHDHAIVYRLELPRSGATLALIETIPVPIEGQGIAWDRTNDDGRLYGIRRSSRTVVASQLSPTPISMKQ